MRWSKVAILVLAAVLFTACSMEAVSGATSKASNTAASSATAKGEKAGLHLKVEQSSNGEAKTGALMLYVNVLDYDDSAKTLTIELDNQSGYDMTFDESFGLEKKNGSTWETLVPTEPMDFDQEGKPIKDLEKVTLTLDISKFEQLTAGEYRVEKNGMYGTFTLED